MEYVGASKRIWTGTIIQFFGTTGALYLILMAYLLRDWKKIQLSVGIPGVLYIFYIWYIFFYSFLSLQKCIKKKKKKKKKKKHFICQGTRHFGHQVAFLKKINLIRYLLCINTQRQVNDDLSRKKTSQR